jgi:hypothetical protein
MTILGRTRVAALIAVSSMQALVAPLPIDS